MGRPASRWNGRRGLALLSIGALLLAALLQGRFDARAAAQDDVDPMLYLPSGKYLKVASLGFDEILADLIYLWSIQYYGNYSIEDRYLYLEHIYDQVVSELDPHYLDPYLIGSLIMNLEAGDPEQALRLLDKGIGHNPDRWILAFEAGFLCYNDLGDYARAATYFEQALRSPDVHPLVRRLHAEMYNRAGNKRTSLREWAEIYETSDDEYVREIAWKHVRDLKVEIDLADLQDAIALYQVRFGAWPRHLDALRREGLVESVPHDPDGNDYRYDPRTGLATHEGGLVVGG
jgi:tetratricopeptide (TPR) repeat protein